MQIADPAEMTQEFIYTFSDNDNGSDGSGNFLFEDANYTDCEPEDNDDLRRIFVPIIYSVICVMGVIGNGLVVLVMGYQQKSRTMTDKYRLHLSVADLLFVFTLPFWSVDAAAAKWYFGGFFCKVIHVVYTVNFYSSVLILAFISLDRYLAIVHATNSQKPRKLLAEKVVYACVWLPALLLAVPDMVFAKVREEKDGSFTCDRIYPEPAETSLAWMVAHRFQHIIVGLLLPGIVILTCYCIIISKLSQSKGYQKRRALKTTVILIVTFFACWLPYYVGIFIDAFQLLDLISYSCTLEIFIRRWLLVTEALAFFHCCLNPILYAFLGAKFKKSAQNALTTVSRGSSLKILSKKRNGLSSVSTESESSSFHSS
ncbi:C-X-C chemokine receptor type 4 [Protopterus annectens]|uniref:CXCR4 n=1 Tax=Protopterus annectens TaxID=7888 RepID=A0A2U9NKN6_PROAN|nr:C-X-C chemokine receptor type 4 [Protopterus annectens]AWT24625.1 CXCR4 [Protopterus annectens]